MIKKLCLFLGCFNDDRKMRSVKIRGHLHVIKDEKVMIGYFDISYTYMYIVHKHTVDEEIYSR